MKVGLALEGGGARGAYHIGAVKALLERKYKITAVVGTSIGAINAAMIAQNKFEEAYDLWENLSYDTIFDIDNEKITDAIKKKINLDIVKYISSKIASAVKSGGVDTSKMRGILNTYIDEDKIRKGKVLFGLVTYCLTDKRALEIFIDDIPKGQLIEYILASSRLPGFKQEKIDEKYYMDGGVDNNCPINMLVDKGYKDIFAIRTGSIFRIKNIREIRKRKDLNITYIEPRNKLPNILSFDDITAGYLLKLGYFDTVKALDKLDGYNYYINHVEEEKVFGALSNLDISIINSIYKTMGVKENNYNSRQKFFESILPGISKRMDIDQNNTYKSYLLGILEYVANKEEINRFKVYELKELIDLTRSLKSKKKKKNKIEQVIYKIIKYIEL